MHLHVNLECAQKNQFYFTSNCILFFIIILLVIKPFSVSTNHDCFANCKTHKTNTV